MNPSIDFLSMLRSSTPVTPDVAEELLRTYPFFTLPALMMLQRDNEEHILSPEKREWFMAAAALNAGDTATMMKLIDRESERWFDLYPAEKENKKSTEDTIDTFLNTYGKTDARETELLEKLIFNPVPDYSQVLEMEEQQSPSAPSAEAEADSQLARINSFIEKSRVSPEEAKPEEKNEDQVVAATEPEKPQAKEPEPQKAKPSTPGESGLLSESLAKIYIKQHKYEKAFEILSNLKENFPQRSPFYDDQLRFLRKILVNSRATNI